MAIKFSSSNFLGAAIVGIVGLFPSVSHAFSCYATGTGSGSSDIAQTSDCPSGATGCKCWETSSGSDTVIHAQCKNSSGTTVGTESTNTIENNTPSQVTLSCDSL